MGDSIGRILARRVGLTESAPRWRLEIYRNIEAAVRSAGVSPRTLRKLEHRGVLTPDNIIELRNRRVDDELVVHHLDTVGVDYIAQKDDIKSLRSAGVRQPVIAALTRASNRHAGYLSAPPPSYYSHGYYGDPWYYPYSPRYYYDPWWPQGEVGITYGRHYRHW